MGNRLSVGERRLDYLIVFSMLHRSGTGEWYRKIFLFNFHFLLFAMSLTGSAFSNADSMTLTLN